MTKKQDGLHESYARDEEKVVGTDRSFGLVFVVFFAIVGGWSLYRGKDINVVYGLFGASGVFLLLSFVAPKALHPLNVAWMAFGRLLHKVVSPIIMGLLFFVTITPIALLMRAMGKDVLRLRLDSAAKSYWIERTPPGPPPETMRNQF